MAGIVFEDEDKVDLVLVPHAAGKREQDDEEVDEEVASVYLQQIAGVDAQRGVVGVVRVCYTGGLDEALDAQTGAGRDQHAVAERVVGVVAGSRNLNAQLADRHLVVASLEVPRVEVFDGSNVAFDDVAVDEPGPADFVVHVAHGRACVYGLIVLFVDLAERCAVEQGVRLQQLEPAVVLLQGDLELPLRRLVGYFWQVWTSSKVTAVVVVDRGLEDRWGRERRHGFGARSVFAGAHCLERGIDWIQPGSAHLLTCQLLLVGVLVEFFRLTIRWMLLVCLLLHLGRLTLDQLVQPSVPHDMQLVAQHSQATGRLVLLLLVEVLDLLQLRIQKLEELGLAEVELLVGLERDVGGARFGVRGAHGQDALDERPRVRVNARARPRHRVHALRAEDAAVACRQRRVLLAWRPRLPNFKSIAVAGRRQLDGLVLAQRCCSRAAGRRVHGSAWQPQRRRRPPPLRACILAAVRAPDEAAIARAQPVVRVSACCERGLLGRAREV
ncbi:hypothetical protein C7974DRAFT_387447 [Boeremia exigua]|uniref:uncharacterized protein n=1 Tax=Boeremia exigua TaxID=749465 RepID=UPI001E8E9EDF|nr:uncharacterized protein C7974DRAFT_387447 [Boeremia exigua]KAH6638859.1 hypothetical protein C7974DRAFT_387447 [Boeremia exigua]